MGDQVDLSDAGFSVSIALLGVAGFLEWSLNPDRLMSWLS